MDHLGLDLGTTTISAAVLDADGRLLCTRTVPGGAAVAGQPWERKQDARGIEHAALSLLDGLLQEFPDIGCVGLTGQMHGIVYVDAAGQLLSPLYTWQDETGAQPGPDGKSTAARLTERTGYPLASGYGLVTLACHQAAGCIPDGAAAVCTIADYLAMRLSGRSAPCLTPSMAASLGLFDGTGFDRSCRRSRRRRSWAAGGCASLPRSATIRQAFSEQGMDGLMRRSSTSARAASFRSSRRNAAPCRGWKRAPSPAAGC